MNCGGFPLDLARIRTSLLLTSFFICFHDANDDDDDDDDDDDEFKNGKGHAELAEN